MLSTSSEKKKYHLWFRTDWDQAGESLTFLLESSLDTIDMAVAAYFCSEAHDPGPSWVTSSEPESHQQVILEL